MKRILLFLSLLTTSATAQTITLAPIANLQFCTGDTLVVSYKASGNFASDNFFTLQLSDANGSFGTFLNSGHDTSKNGTFFVPLTSAQAHLRVRAASTDPYLVSSDNGSDITVSSHPNPSIRIKNNSSKQFPIASIIGFAGQAFTLSDASSEAPGCSFLWTFDSASGVPSSTDSTVQVTFPQDGNVSVRLQVKNVNGCSSETTASYSLLSCYPEIPKTATIDDGSMGPAPSYSVIVVKTGANLTGFAKWSTIFAEPGSSISLNQGGLIGGLVYLARGASFSAESATLGPDGHYPIVVMTPDRTLTSNGMQYQYDTMYCPDLTFGTAEMNGVPGGQFISLGKFPTNYSVGDSIVIPYSATGTFGDGNFFSLQLSDSNGSFTSFTNVGRDTLLNGSIGFRITTPGKNYRVRIASSDPYLASSDSGQVISALASGVHANAPSDLLRIFQTAENLLIDSKNGVIKADIYSFLGSKVLSRQSSGTLDLDLSNLPAGVYFAVVESGGVRQVRKILVGY